MSGTIIALCALLSAPAAALRWAPYDEAAFQAAKASGRLVIAQIVGDGCAPCTAHQRSLERLFPGASEDVVAIRADIGGGRHRFLDLEDSRPGVVLAFRGSREILRTTEPLTGADLNALLLAARFAEPRGRALARPSLRRPPRP